MTTTTDTRNCTTCGATFTKSRQDYTRRCKDCRAGRSSAREAKCANCNDTGFFTTRRASTGATETHACFHGCKAGGAVLMAADRKPTQRDFPVLFTRREATGRRRAWPTCRTCGLVVAPRNRNRHERACLRRKRQAPDLWLEWKCDMYCYADDDRRRPASDPLGRRGGPFTAEQVRERRAAT